MAATHPNNNKIAQIRGEAISAMLQALQHKVGK